MSDSYQAIYDAVRSRISGGNISDAVDRAAREAFDMGNTRAIAIEAIEKPISAENVQNSAWAPATDMTRNRTWRNSAAPTGASMTTQRSGEP